MIEPTLSCMSFCIFSMWASGSSLITAIFYYEVYFLDRSRVIISLLLTDTSTCFYKDDRFLLTFFLLDMWASTTYFFNLSLSLFILSSYKTFLISSFFVDYSRLIFAYGDFFSSMTAISDCFFELEPSLMIYPSPISCSLQIKTGGLPCFKLATIS